MKTLLKMLVIKNKIVCDGLAPRTPSTCDRRFSVYRQIWNRQSHRKPSDRKGGVQPVDYWIQQILIEDIGYISNETNTDVCVYKLKNLF